MRKEILKTNIWEIKKSGSLKTLGGLLALFHVLQFYFWSVDGRLPVKLVQQGLPMCWSFMENCGWLHLPVGLLTVVYFAYIVFVAGAAAVLILTDWVAFGYNLLLIGSVLGLILYFQDLRLSTNEGYFLFFMTFAYLFVPSKHRLMRRLIVSFFVARGLSQCVADWLTGSWFLDHMHISLKLAEWLAALGVLAQMIGGAAMLFRDARYFWSGWLSLFIYECAYLYIGEVLGSCLALGALVYVALDELELRKAERQYIYQSFIRPEPSFLWAGILLSVFWAAQLSPFLTLPRESSIKGLLSIWALHPEAAHEECEQKTLAVFKNRREEIEVQSLEARQPAQFCNPYLRYLDLRATCKHLQENDSDFITLSSVFQVHNFRERTSYRAFEVKDFCAPELTFKRLAEVQWTTNPGK
jgi:hypothetical protein